MYEICTEVLMGKDDDVDIVTMQYKRRERGTSNQEYANQTLKEMNNELRVWRGGGDNQPKIKENIIDVVDTVVKALDQKAKPYQQPMRDALGNLFDKFAKDSINTINDSVKNNISLKQQIDLNTEKQQQNYMNLSDFQRCLESRLEAVEQVLYFRRDLLKLINEDKDMDNYEKEATRDLVNEMCNDYIAQIKGSSYKE